MGLYFRSLRSSYRKIQPWLIWVLGAAFFFFTYFARVDPSVIVPELMTAFHIGAFALGGLSALFYYPYVVMQLPAGILVDRFGPHRLLAVAAFIFAVACLLFARSSQLWVAELSRAVMGFSAAFAFIGTLKLAALWLMPRYLGLLAGLTQGIGMLGAAVGQNVFAFSTAHIGWREAIVLFAWLMMLVAILIGLAVRDRKPTLLNRLVSETSQIPVWDSVMIVLRNPYSWRVALYAGLIYAPTGAFAEFWGPSFLQRVHELSRQWSVLAISAVFVGLAVGGALVGWQSDRMGVRRPILIASAISSLLLMLIILYVPKLPILWLFIVLFLYGVANMGISLAYAVASECNPKSLSGISIAFTNMASVLIVALLQPFIGWLLLLRWHGVYVDGYPLYSAADYQSAMILLPLLLLMAIGVALSIKETYCRSR